VPFFRDDEQRCAQLLPRLPRVLLAWQLGHRAIICAGLSGPPWARSWMWSISRIGSPLSVRSSMSPVQLGFSHLPSLRSSTARLASAERTGSADVLSAHVLSLPVQNTSTLSHSRRYPAVCALSAASAGLPVCGPDRPSSSSSAVGSASRVVPGRLCEAAERLGPQREGQPADRTGLRAEPFEEILVRVRRMGLKRS
jgi:hypothetical protein